MSRQFGIDLANDPNLDRVDRFADHPVTQGIHSLYFRAGGTILVSPPARGVAWSSSNIAVATSEVGKGRVLAVGDTNFWENLFYEDEGEVFAQNGFDWLSKKTP